MEDLSAVENVLYLADSYKISHHKQYPPGTEYVYSYFESRGGKFPEVCFFGLQYIIKRWLLDTVVTREMVAEAKEFFAEHFGEKPGDEPLFNEKGWLHIVEKHNGRLPLRIRAVPEGLVVPVRNVVFTVENTDPKVPWLTNWFETLLLQAWYPMTVCTISRAMKEVIARFMHATSDSLEGLHFKLHDFGYRGVSSVESAAIGGAAHLVNFLGTDTVAALRMFYGTPMAGFSIPAAEHSTMTAWGQKGETEAYKNMLERFPTGLVSVVADSYDLFNAVTNIFGDELRKMVLARADKGRIVIRPDSGDPATIVLKVLTLLGEKFPTTVNSKGFRLLPEFLRVIQGDGISYSTLEGILQAIKDAGWSTENVVFGAGGALLQRLDRDTQRCAFKCSHVVVNGESRDVCKNPATDAKKRSKKGYLTLEQDDDGQFATLQEGRGDESKDLLVTVYEDGRLLVDYTMAEIRERAEIPLLRASNGTNGGTNGTNGHAAHLENGNGY